jgi:glutamate/tyrosine decarboxylase-like PLP-dependent enzyme
MRETDWKRTLQLVAELSTEYLQSLPSRPVRAERDARAMLDALALPLPEHGQPPEQLVPRLAATLDPGLCAMGSGRFFGWVIGGALPSALAADLLTSVYDQNAGMAEPTPSAAMAEQVALDWVRELLGLPPGGAALVTGAQMATTTCLLAARGALLAHRGWDVEADGLAGAPELHVVVSDESHSVIGRSLRVLGLGTARARRVACDGQGRMRADAFAEVLSECDGPTLVCAQAGNVNSGAFDPLDALADVIAARAAQAGSAPVWLHVDGAFGLWARASASRRGLAAGAERADSWATDAHKWLNTPYDCGIAFTRDAAAHARSLSVRAAYLPEGHADGIREPMDFNPEFSRRARGFAVYAALLELGRAGVQALVDRCCDHAARFARELGAAEGVSIRNDVQLNQVCASPIRRAPTTTPTPARWSSESSAAACAS